MIRGKGGRYQTKKIEHRPPRVMSERADVGGRDHRFRRRVSASPEPERRERGSESRRMATRVRRAISQREVRVGRRVEGDEEDDGQDLAPRPQPAGGPLERGDSQEEERGNGGE